MKMAGASYNVGKADECATKRDTSFRSCVCALLVVLCICLIGLLISAFYRKDRNNVEDKNNLYGNQNQNQDFVSKFSTTKFTKDTTSITTTVQVDNATQKNKEPVITTNNFDTAFSSPKQNGNTTLKIIEPPSTFVTETTTKRFDSVTQNIQGSVTTKGKDDRKSTYFEQRNVTFTDQQVNEKFTEANEITEVTPNTSNKIESQRNSTTIIAADTGTTPAKTTQAHQTISQIAPTYLRTTTTPDSQNTTTSTISSINEETIITTETPFVISKIITTENSQAINANKTQTLLNNILNISAFTTNFEDMQTTTEQNFANNIRNIVFSTANDVCETASCKSAAVDILMSMNQFVDPCDNFYEFACGKFTKKKSQSKDEFFKHINQINDMSPDYLKIVKIFFDSCVSHESEFLSSETIRQARQLVDNVGEIQIDVSSDVSVQDFSELLAKLILRQSVPFFDIDLGVFSMGINSSYILQLTLPQHSASKWSSLSENRRRCLRLQSGKTYGMNLNLTEIYESFLECQKDYSVYLDSMENVVRTLGMLDGVKNDSQLLSIIKEIRFTVEDVLKILEILPSPYEVRRLMINQNMILMTQNDLSGNFSQLDWNVFLKTLISIPFSSNTRIGVFNSNYFTTAFQELSKLGYRRVFNALVAIYAQDVYSNVVFEPVISNRDDFCAERTFDTFPDIVNYIYKNNERNLNVEKNLTEIIFNKLKEQLSLSLKSASNWMENDAIVQFQNKINKTTLRFSETSDFNPSEFENRYRNFTMAKYAYVNNLEQAMVKRRRNYYSLWGRNVKSPQIFQIFLKPASDQPLLFQNDSTLYIPDDLLKSIHEEQPFYLSVSSVGWKLAKALTTIFHPLQTKSILSKSSTYTSLVESTRDQLKHVNEIDFKGRTVTFNWNGSLSVNKRIVDNTAFRLLLDAAQPDDSFNELPLPLISLYYSREKIIFISVVQEFCEETPLLSYMERLYESENLPASLMVENVLINSQNFATTFDCKPGSSMNIFDVRYQFPYLEKVEDYNNYEYEVNN